MTVRIFKASSLLPRHQADDTACPFPFLMGIKGVHEVTASASKDRAAALGFALTSWQLAAQQASSSEQARAMRPCLWITQKRGQQDSGQLFHRGLTSLLGQKLPCLMVETFKPKDALWATEEAIREHTLSCVVTEIEALDFTASRRLSLASAKYGTPLIILSASHSKGATASQSRWRVSAASSAPNPFDPHAIGHPRWRATLERHRLVPHLAGRTYDLEYNNETVSLCSLGDVANDKMVERSQEYRPPWHATG